MAHQYDNYSDPYDRNGHYAEPSPYGESPKYPSYAGDPSASGEKLDDGSNLDYGNGNMNANYGTARQQQGRQGPRPGSSWTEMGPPPRSTGILRMWRKDARGKQWFKGGGCRSFLRLCCCCGTITIILIVSIVLAILLVSVFFYPSRNWEWALIETHRQWVRPPNIALNSVNVGSSPVSLTNSGLIINFDLSISVSNPNWFAADFKEIVAVARYPGNNTNIFGGGSLYNVDFAGYTESTFQFPFTLNYTTALDPNKVILTDLISKCGIEGGAVQDITVDYDLTLKLKVLGVTVSPKISSSASFECPITQAEIESIGGSISGL
ncbi:hypothetical protein P7C73_g1674, partial [Tremellales sp. Uapishka_1]